MSDWLPGTKNAAGVYYPTEVLRLPRDSKAWRGIDRVEIELVETPEGWRAATGFAFWCGSHWGSFRPLTDDCPAHATREAAVKAQAGYLHERFAKLDDPAMQREAREMLAWADGLIPAQPDLFGRAA